jgi:AraC-like DNA-binding protein
VSCGMTDQSHFSRWFRRIVGETPHQWRRTRRGALEHAPNQTLTTYQTAHICPIAEPSIRAG